MKPTKPIAEAAPFLLGRAGEGLIRSAKSPTSWWCFAYSVGFALGMAVELFFVSFF